MGKQKRNKRKERNICTYTQRQLHSTDNECIHEEIKCVCNRITVLTTIVNFYSLFLNVSINLLLSRFYLLTDKREKSKIIHILIDIFKFICRSE